MSEETHNADNVVEFRAYTGHPDRLTQLDGFVMSDLAPIIGFERGAYALHNAGFQFIGDLVAASPEAIAEVPGIGTKKLVKICDYIASLGLSFGEDTSEWRSYRKKFEEDEPERPCPQVRPREQRRHLKLVSG